MARPFGGFPVGSVSLVVLALALAIALAVLRRLGTGDTLAGRARTRLVLGVPWGTVTVVAGLLAVYFLLQGALFHPGEPLVIAFRSWSYTYPLGMLVAPFGHGSEGHLVGNLLATVTLAPIAEFAWGHRASEGTDLPLGDVIDSPIRRVGAFVAGVGAVGLLTSLFVPGPLIGFSGVVFAFAGVGLVTFPLATVVAIVATDALRLLYYSLQAPVYTARAQEIFYTPGWVDVAIHGHALGLLVGVFAGVFVARRSKRTPAALHVWIAAVVFGVAEGLYTFYWPAGPSEYVLFRGLGLAAVVVYATLLPLGLGWRGRRPVRDALPGTAADGGSGGGSRGRRVALVLLALPVVGLALFAVPFNAAPPDATGAGDGVSVGDYRVTYAEDVPDGSVRSIGIPGLGDSLDVTRSGVIVTSERRGVWDEVVSSGDLAFQGRSRVIVGGLGWREAVIVNRTGWGTVDGSATYAVTVRRQGGEPRRVFAAEPVTVPGIYDGKRVVVRPTADGFSLVVERNETIVGTAPIPEPTANATVGNLTFARNGRDLLVVYGETRVKIATFQLSTGS